MWPIKGAASPPVKSKGNLLTVKMVGEQMTSQISLSLCFSKPLTNAKDSGRLQESPTLEAFWARLAAEESYHIAYTMPEGCLNKD